MPVEIIYIAFSLVMIAKKFKLLLIANDISLIIPAVQFQGTRTDHGVSVLLTQ